MASQIIERSLYNGLYEMVHNPTAVGRQPRYVVNGSQKPQGVTTILGKVIAKDLTGWAIECACEYLRSKLPVVTEEDLQVAAKAYTKKRDFGANTGSEAHALVEHFLKGSAAPSGASKEAKNAYDAFVGWFESVGPEVVNVEEVIFSPTFNYAGTYDCMLKIGGKVYLCDLKTTNASKRAPRGVYAEHFLQLGAYAAAHEEQRQYEAANGGTTLVPIEGLMVISAKKNGKLDIVTSEELNLPVEACMTMFKRVRNLHEFISTTTKQLGGS